MQIKAADDRSPQISALEALLRRRYLAVDTRRRVEAELRTIQAGAKAERDAAYQIEFHCANNRNVMSIHDLRIEVGGRVAQIDHLLLNRLLEVWICETKAFIGGVAINEHGEWSTYFAGRPRGIKSPIEQNREHVAVLSDVFGKGLVSTPTRLGIKLMPEIRSLVLVSSRAQINRPRNWKRLEGLDTVIKSDQLIATIDRAVSAKLESALTGKDLGALLSLGKAVGSEELETIARQLGALHRPIAFDWSKRFGVPTTEVPQSGNLAGGVCASCSRSISSKVLDYCTANARRFRGRILCWDCQRREAGTRN